MPKKQRKSLAQMEISIGGVNLTTKALFTKHLAVMLKSGLTMPEALRIANESAKGKFKNVLSGVIRSVESGESLANSFSRYPKVFSGIFISAIRAGEVSGNLEKNLQNLATQLGKEKELRDKVKGAMFYPVVVLIAAGILGLALSFFLLPKITPLFQGLDMDLPITTKFLIWFSDLVQNHGGKLFLGITFSIIFLWWLLRKKFMKPIIHKLLLITPIVKNISQESNIARFTRILGTLLQSGLTIDQALGITQETLGNHYYKQAVGQIHERIGKGSNLSDNLTLFPNLFPLIVTRMVHVGENSGDLEGTLIYLADFYENEVDNSTKALSTIIEPVLLMGIGLVVGFLALSIITPIYNITGGVK